MSKVHYPWFKREDIDAFFALFQNNLANFVLIALLMLGMGFPAEIVYGRIIPGAAVAVLLGNIYYAYAAKRLAEKENRADVTALAYGISTPVMFVFLFGVLKPALDLTGDPDLAWRIGIAAAAISGAIEAVGSVGGEWIRRALPRAAMLGALAGIALTFIAGELLFRTFEAPLVGILVLGIILLGILGKVTMPFKLPSTLFAMIIGTVIAYVLGIADVNQISEGFANVGFYPLLPTLAPIEGFGYLFGSMVGLLAVILPISIYNFIETMNNVEAMEAVGDSYSVQEAQLVDGMGTIIGAFFGGAFPTTVYIASVGSKWMNAGRGYSIINAAVFGLAAVFGIIAAISAMIPISVIAPILVFVGVSMVSQAFISSPKHHSAAVAIAMLPYFANYIMTRFGAAAGEVVAGISTGIVPLGQGAMFSGLIWGAIAVYILDRELVRSAKFSFVGAALSFVGFMHAPGLAIGAANDFAIGYVLLGIVFLIFHYTGAGDPRDDVDAERMGGTSID